MFKALSVAILFTIPSLVSAKCDFVTSRYAKELQEPQSVQRIEIEVNKSKKWAMNGIRMLVDNQENIHPKWKKRFSAKVKVSYPFGTCTHPADIRQSGDWRDHTEFVNGKLRQSLDVQLEAGNVANAVEFKLFLPETRLGNNETLAALILRKLDILAPKTFMVDVEVNGIQGPYLFQEKESKELLEAMGRREGPMFEGDEELLWSYKNFDTFELEPVSGVRLVNGKWARRGTSSALMAFNAFLELQHQYVNFPGAGSSNYGAYYFINPNARLNESPTFPEYHAMAASIHGMHSLRLHNRKFYWNALAGEFEPLYYDGNVTFEPLNLDHDLRNRPIERDLFRENLKLVDYGNLKSLVSKMQTDDFIGEFAVLAKLQLDAARDFVEPRFDQILKNLDEIAAFASVAPSGEVREINYESARAQFINLSEEFGLKQQFISPIDGVGTDFSFDCVGKSSCNMAQIDVEQVVKLMADQEHQDMRTVILPNGKVAAGKGAHRETDTDIAVVRHSMGATVEYDAVNRELKLFQSQTDDWFLIKNVNLSDITVSMAGVEQPLEQEASEQRFNEYGLTGCLTFYNVLFDKADINVIDGACEDSLNLVSSEGSIDEISITNGFADAIDLDFSDIQIGRIAVNKAGNDCLDVSGGTYVFEKADLVECGDKGISAGENSYVSGKIVAIDTALIGASSKDYSLLLVQEFSASNVQTCLEAFQKKEEFGGANIDIKTENCDRSQIMGDENSSILLGGVRFELSN